MRPSTQSWPMSATSTLRTPSSQPRRTSSIPKTSCSVPRSTPAATRPDGEVTWMPTSQAARGPTNRQTSTSCSRPSATLSVISASVSSMMPLPWLIRWTRTPWWRAASSTARNGAGPSTEGISTRYLAPSPKRLGEAGSSPGSPAGRPSSCRNSRVAVADPGGATAPGACVTGEPVGVSMPLLDR